MPAVVEPEPDSAALRQRITELEDQSLRTMADLDNLRKRHARELTLAREEERVQVASSWLPVLDTLDLALAHAEADPASIVAGVAAVREQALQVLNQLGYPRRDDEGTQFDPAWHEAVAAVPDDDRPAGTVVQVVRPGYGGAARQLRPAAVVVAREDE
ncbi:nucleotide exchange factor GrpE [Natronosporangium hydrolyticum]|uniref:Protein GrpE n=2 Tax=Natronosporangium hydrolyticum TaxID=2811111 RepID=A0A895YT48_9ACTN|nr:nucleotide exchange factor GrpE [Natronosporangium hydrolyticum]